MVKSTRERVLLSLLRQPRSTIQELAHSVGINPISTRHHLNNLQAEGLITSEEERHGIGRPRLVYTLTAEGQERFPTRYFQLTNRLLDQINRIVNDETKEKIYQGLVDEISREIDANVSEFTIDQKLHYAKDLLAREGFIIEWIKSGDELHVKEISCPYYHIGQYHPEICIIDQALISRIFNVQAKKISCILQGDQNCTFVIPH